MGEKIWCMAGLLGLPLLGLASGLYKGGAALAGLGLGLGLALGMGIMVWAAGRAAGSQAPALVWGSLLGYLAGQALLSLLAPFPGLTWMLAAPYHHDAIRLACMLAATALLLAGPLAGRWPHCAGWRGALPGPGARGLLLALFLGGLLLLAMGVTASGGAAASAGGLKGLLKNPKLLLLGLGGAGLALAWAAASWPGPVLGAVLPALGFALVWSGWCLRSLSAMGPLLDFFRPETLQALLLAAFFWAGLGLARTLPPEKGVA